MISAEEARELQEEKRTTARQVKIDSHLNNIEGFIKTQCEELNGQSCIVYKFDNSDPVRNEVISELKSLNYTVEEINSYEGVIKYTISW